MIEVNRLENGLTPVVTRPVNDKEPAAPNPVPITRTDADAVAVQTPLRVAVLNTGLTDQASAEAEAKALADAIAKGVGGTSVNAFDPNDLLRLLGD